MAVQLSVAVRNARLDALETAVGVSAVLKIRTGAQPANCAAADSGTVLATMSVTSPGGVVRLAPFPTADKWQVKE